jgi:hypothetical protein
LKRLLLMKVVSFHWRDADILSSRVRWECCHVLEGSNDVILMVRASTFLYICKGLGFMSRILMHELMNTVTLFSAAETLHSKESIQSKFTCNSFSNH